MKNQWKLLLLPIVYIAIRGSVSNAEATSGELVQNCDSIFTQKGFSVSHRFIGTAENEKNAIFTFRKTTNGKTVEIFRDTIFSTVQKIMFVDYNNDKVKDILVQNSSDVRSNWTYYLYLVHPKTFELAKVAGFEEIEAPKYNAKYDIVENYVMSGRNWTSFYKISKNKVRDLGFVIYDADDKNGVNHYDRDYKNALKKIAGKK